MYELNYIFTIITLKKLFNVINTNQATNFQSELSIKFTCNNSFYVSINNSYIFSLFCLFLFQGKSLAHLLHLIMKKEKNIK